MKQRQDPRWPHAHQGVKRLYEERVPEGMSQAEFGAQFGLGVQGMVWQYLNGYTPLNYDAAAKFAKGLRCTIRDFSPEMADELEAGIVPFLGRKVRRVAALALVALLPLFAPQPADAAILHKIFGEGGRNTHWRRFVLTLLTWLNLAAIKDRRHNVSVA